MADRLLLTRTLRLGHVGSDVEGCKRAVYRYLDESSRWLAFVRSAPLVRSTFGPVFREAVKVAQIRLGVHVDGQIGPATERALRAEHAFDEYADWLLERYALKHPRLFYPHPAGPGVYVGQGLHQTGGLPGNFAIDFMAPGGTPVLASCAARVTKLSGHPPGTGTHGPGDVFGWSLYLYADGRTYYLTHLGTRLVAVGDDVRAGEQIGTVGRWPNDPGRSHLHEGVTSTRGAEDARRRITEIARAPHLPDL